MRHRELVVTKITLSHRFHLLRCHRAQTRDQFGVGVNRQALHPLRTQLARLIEQ